jgi:hypothetical protein
MVDSSVSRTDAHRFYRREQPTFEATCFGWTLRQHGRMRIGSAHARASAPQAGDSLEPIGRTRWLGDFASEHPM